YYFGGKKGIYAAALENIVEAVREETAEISKEYDVVVRSKNSAEARELLKKFTKVFLYLLCGEKLSRDMKTVFLSEYSKPTEDFSILYEGLILPFYKKMANLLGLASENKISTKDAYLYMFPFFAQLFVFSSRQDTICKFMEWKTYEEPEKQKLLDYMYNQIDFLIDSHK
ncbi:MAG: CerR family C-terminal domain-containing protein, partial [Alphaproteobacteria bacterium]|nr:CerR family C-terminal domain-containing protein [Alphaproteobacteria bacterium]